MAEQLLWFSLAVLPLVLVPGPDMMLCVAQGLTRGPKGVLRAVNGIALGYLAHALLAAAGVAALITASPTLFETLRWIGIAYLIWIAIGMLRSALRSHAVMAEADPRTISLRRGFLTAFLNPKGLMVYLSIVPQFIDPAAGNLELQALLLSVMNAVLCYVVYLAAGLLAVRSSRAIGGSSLRVVEGIGGALVGGIAVKLAVE